MKKTNTYFQGVLWEIISSSSFVILGTLVKCLSTELPTSAISFYRTAIAFFFLIPFVYKKRIKKPSKDNIPWYLLRTLIAVTTVNTAFYVFKELPLSFVMAIGYTEPMIQLLFSVLFFQASISIAHWMLMLLGYSGIFIIAYSKMGGNSDISSYGIIAAILLSFLISTVKTITKQQTKKEPAHQVLFYNNLLNIFTITIFTTLTTPSFTTMVPSQQACICLPFLGLFGFLTQYGFTKALSLTDMHLIAPITYLRLIIAIPIGFYLYGEIPTWSSLIGILIIISANFGLLRSEKKRQLLSKKNKEKEDRSDNHS